MQSDSESEIVDRIGVESEERNTGIERFPFHQSVLPLEKRSLDSRNHWRPAWLHDIEQSPSPDDSSLLNVVHQLRGGLARPWPKVRDSVRSSRSDYASIIRLPGP